MKLQKGEAHKYDYAVDIFKGTCELNGYDYLFITDEQRDLGKLLTDIIGEREEMDSNVYFQRYRYNDACFGAICKAKNKYAPCEFINMAVKFLTNLGLSDIWLLLNSSLDGFVRDNLEALDIQVHDVRGEEYFSVFASGTLVIHGMDIGNNLLIFYVSYNDIKGFIPEQKDEPLDAYIAPQDESVLDDAFIMGTNLKDSGFKVLVDYSLKKVKKEDIESSFLITFDANDIKAYKVKLVDLATKEEKNVGIDNLVEELMYR